MAGDPSLTPEARTRIADRSGEPAEALRMLRLARAGLRSGHSLPRLVLFALRLGEIRLHSLGWELLGAVADLWNFRRRDRTNDLGFVVHWPRIVNGTFFEAGSTDLWRRLVTEAEPRIIRSRLGYRLHAGELRRVIALEPFTFAPPVRFRREHSSVLSLFDVIDKAWMAAHLGRVGADVIISPNVDSVPHVPVLAEMTDLPWRFFAWSVPDDVPQRWTREALHARVVTVGAAGQAYSLRNWVGRHPLTAGHIRVTSHEADLPTVDRDAYFALLAAEPAIVVAFGDDERHRITVAKYLEVPAVGSLLIAARSPRLERLGLRDGWNCLVFDGRDDFAAKIQEFLDDPAAHLELARRGQGLISERHTTSVRLREIDELLARLEREAPEPLAG
jgi:hypothetical protein